MLPFHKVVENDFQAVNQLIIDQLHSNVDLVENIGHYLVEAGGKRLRPLLVLLTANALGYGRRRHLELAAVIEFIHTATLLHDDVVDISALRRGRPTANAKWGNAPSVLVGDFLYSRAFQMMVAIGNMDIMTILADTTNTISEGEVQQLVNAKDPTVTEDRYLSVIHKKTAALFEAACETAAVLVQADANNTDRALRAVLRRYGYHLGMAFQLIDDVLDYQGDAEALGKNVGDDLAEGKPTLPLIHAMQHADRAEAQLIAGAIREGAVEQLPAIVDIVKNSGGLAYTQARARREADRAIAELSQLPDNIHSRAMVDLAKFAISRLY
ncbi:octaprenyl diphosphate synthase [Exilibacterium tricleocarpae]|uniref:Octaprenyl diphosphate synthase n=1 Tax=Exilibacterium tricleocarpae TaxID=2591008 RepID=A0A545T2D3_9GAMM|nr:polyprenyl synthetase family protein [Exilibacterium tricleocarpae]TQV71363.1 octaprenyl diphosphate synthase [Exilibacterium tricleocarpae]